MLQILSDDEGKVITAKLQWNFDSMRKGFCKGEGI